MTDAQLEYIQDTPQRIPKSNAERIIFPYDKKAKEFKMAGEFEFRIQDRAHIREIQTFLDQINIPLKKWHEDNAFLWKESPLYCCFLIICFILLPLLIMVICYHSARQNKALKELKDIMQKSKIFVEENNSRFLERGLLWTFPVHFPRWIELWMQQVDPRDGMPVDIMQVQKTPEIQTIEVRQRDYENDQEQQQGFYSSVQQDQNQFSSNMYNQNVYS